MLKAISLLPKMVILPVIMILLLSWQTLSNAETGDIEMTLTECIDHAIKNNLDIKLVTLNTESAGEDIRARKSDFDPYLDAKFYGVKSVSPNTYVLEEMSQIKSSTVGESMGISQKLPTGTSYSVSLDTSRRKYDATLQSLNPTYETDLTFSLSQSLLKNLGYKVNKAFITIAMNNKAISLMELEKKMSDIIYSVIGAYWDLTYKLEDSKAKEKSLELAKQLNELNKTQIEVGTLAEVEIFQSESAMATREEALIVAQYAVNEAKETLRNIMNFKIEDPEWLDKNILPKDKPETTLVDTDMNKSISRALDKNYDMKQSKLALENNDIMIKYNKNGMLPSLDLNQSLTLNGLTGKASNWEFENSPFAGSYQDSYSNLSDGDYYTYNANLTLKFPLFNRDARSSLAKSNIDKRKTIIGMKKQENDIILTVHNMIRAIETNKKRIDVTKKARDYAQKKLDVEIEKYKLGLSTNFTLLSYQSDLADAISSEVKARVDYQLSVANLKNIEGALLDDYEIKMNNSDKPRLH
jgi:outer membrane protein